MEVKRHIPFFNYPQLFTSQEDEIMSLLRDVLRRGAYVMQKDLSEFEDNLAKYLGVKHVLGVADGTIALVMALMASGLKKGDEVILPSHTFVASAASIHFAGGTPVFAECGSDHMLNPVSVEKLITEKTRMIMPVQLNGRTCDMDSLQKIADKHSLLIVEDAAQALGSKYKGEFAGTIGIAGTFSFYPAKLLGCFGDGGAVVTNDDSVANKVSMLRDHGRGQSGETELWGFNARLDNIQAAILNLKLGSYGQAIKRRREIARMYNDQLKAISSIVLPPAPDDADYFDVFQNYEIEADRRDDLREYLEDSGIHTILQWGGKAVHQFKSLGFDVQLPVTERMTSRFIMLPINVSLSNDDVDYICQKIIDFYNG